MRIRNLLAGLAAAVALGGVAHADDPGGVTIYDGKVGAAPPVRVALAFTGDGGIEGRYAYATSSSDIRLAGQVTNGGKGISLTEYDTAGHATASFTGTFVDKDRSAITGTWTGGGRSMAFSLRESSFAPGGGLDHPYDVAGATNDAAVDRAATVFRKAVIARERAAVAAAVRYPVMVQIAGKRTRVANAKALLAHYDQVFTPAFRARIAADVPRLMFARDQGVMLGGGEIWFGPDGRVTAINN
jgi:hypothetical protein